MKAPRIGTMLHFYPEDHAAPRPAMVVAVNPSGTLDVHVFADHDYFPVRPVKGVRLVEQPGQGGTLTDPATDGVVTNATSESATAEGAAAEAPATHHGKHHGKR